MCVVTEDDVKRRLGDRNDPSRKEILISKKDILTPSAKSYLTEKNIRVKYLEDQETEKIVMAEEIGQEITYEYETLFGLKLNEKPEHMTHLRGNILVFKDHPRIEFRGKIDSLEAEILCVQILAQKQHLGQMVKDLQEILFFVRNLIRCEVGGDRVDEFNLQGLTPEELRDQSHHPSKYFGMKHVLPNHTMGEVVVALNKLRTLARETELVAYKAFKGEYGEVERDDIIKALNRLSSLFWIMMFKFMTDRYKE